LADKKDEVRSLTVKLKRTHTLVNALGRRIVINFT